MSSEAPQFFGNLPNSQKKVTLLDQHHDESHFPKNHLSYLAFFLKKDREQSRLQILKE